MTLTTYAPGRSCRIQLTGSSGRCSTVWVVFSAKRHADIYICPRMSGGAVKVSLHESGSWHVGVSEENAKAHRSSNSRHWEIWQRGAAIGPGTTRAWYLLIPDQELRAAIPDARAHKLPPVGPGSAVSLELLMMANEAPTVAFDDAHLVGRWPLHGRDESCLVLARRIPWTSEQQSWAEEARVRVVAEANAAGVPKSKEHRYFLHGHDLEGVRFGVELAAS